MEAVQKVPLAVELFGKPYSLLTVEEQYQVRKESKNRNFAKHAATVYRKQQEKMDRLMDLFGGKCVECGYDRNKAALDFHHLDPKTKRFPIGLSNCTRSFEELVKEAKKCVLLCCRCHRELHARMKEAEMQDRDVHDVAEGGPGTRSQVIFGKRFRDLTEEQKKAVKLAGSRRYSRSRYPEKKRRWEAFLNQLDVRCSQCGYDKCKAAIDFHHLDPKSRRFSVASCSCTRSLAELMEEAKKCSILCCRCHRELHHPLKESQYKSEILLVDN